MMRRVVITGIGAVSCLGNSKEDVLDSLKEGRSGISFNETFKEMGLKSQVCGSVDIDFSESRTGIAHSQTRNVSDRFQAADYSQGDARHRRWHSRGRRQANIHGGGLESRPVQIDG